MKTLIVITLLVLTLSGCSKDAQTSLDGVYQVMGHDNKGHNYSGVIGISGNKMTIDCGFLTLQYIDVPIVPSGDRFNVTQTALYRAGNGQVVDNHIVVMLKVNYSGGTDQFDFTGSK